MLTPVAWQGILRQRRLESTKGSEGHDGNHYPIMAIMVQDSPFAERKGARGMLTPVAWQGIPRNPHSRHPPSFPRRRESTEGSEGHHGNHYPIMAIMVQNPHFSSDLPDQLTLDV